jgi:hypothetical protein
MNKTEMYCNPWSPCKLCKNHLLIFGNTKSTISEKRANLAISSINEYHLLSFPTSDEIMVKSNNTPVSVIMVPPTVIEVVLCRDIPYLTTIGYDIKVWVEKILEYKMAE